MTSAPTTIAPITEEEEDGNNAGALDNLPPNLAGPNFRKIVAALSFAKDPSDPTKTLIPGTYRRLTSLAAFTPSQLNKIKLVWNAMTDVQQMV